MRNLILAVFTLGLMTSYSAHSADATAIKAKTDAAKTEKAKAEKTKAVPGDGTDISSCKTVVQACTSAKVNWTDKDTGAQRTGYQFGAGKSGKGLWGDCVTPLSKGVAVEGVTATVKKEAAEACLKSKVAQIEKSEKK